MDYSVIKDNHHCGNVGDFLKQEITENSSISVVSAYFTPFAYQQLKPQLDKIEKLQFLFGEPTFIKKLEMIILLHIN